MKYLSCCLFLVAALSCRQRPAGPISSEGISDSLAIKVRGTYIGRSDSDLISIVINYISGKTVSGYDVHKGLRRNLNGELTVRGPVVDFMLMEPGNKPSDGTFFLSPGHVRQPDHRTVVIQKPSPGSSPYAGAGANGTGIRLRGIRSLDHG